MKKLLLSSVTFAAIAGSAFAADLPSIKSAPAVAPAPLWNGFYAGLNAGGTWANNNSINVTTWPIGVGEPTGAALLSGNVPLANTAGFIGGGQIGYNWQVQYRGHGVVSGIEADIQGIAGSGGNNSGLSTAVPFQGAVLYSNTRSTASLSYIGTVRGRIGYVFTPELMVYGTGGLAYGGVNTSLTSFQINGAVSGAAGWGNSSYGSTQVGWTAGGGAEWMFMQNWSAKAEYLYYDLGQASSTTIFSHNFNSGSSGIADYSQSSIRFNGNIVRAGVNYHFNFATAPVVAKY